MSLPSEDESVFPNNEYKLIRDDEILDKLRYHYSYYKTKYNQHSPFFHKYNFRLKIGTNTEIVKLFGQLKKLLLGLQNDILVIF